jgi:hypothetical protein
LRSPLFEKRGFQAEEYLMNSETLQQMWIATMRMAAQLRREGFKIDKAFDLLRNARIILNEHAVDKEVGKVFLPRAAQLIESAQRELFLAAEPLGNEFTEGWEGQFKEIMQGKKVGEFAALRSSTFYASLPRSRNWVRISTSGLPKKKLKEIQRQVEVRPHGEGHVLLIGDKASLRKALDQISPYLRVKK